MHIPKLDLFLLMSSIAVISGCSDVSSTDLKSSGFYANMRVSAQGDGQTNVTVNLSTGSGIDADGIKLDGGDYLEVEAKGNRKRMSRNVGYTTDFLFDDGPTEFVISLYRTSDESMPNSSVTLPQDFVIQTPVANTTFSADDFIQLAWSPEVNGGNIKLNFAGYCYSIDDSSQLPISTVTTLIDNGVHSVGVSSLLNSRSDRDKFDMNKACPITVSLQREAQGSLDPNYGQGGSVWAMQARSVDIQVQP
ncbi:hypothetical protein C2869_21385 [Saccharobesus litoralis]|uniref:Lipoprotein n=1 Tax=Saccharobesus litoralis TaxID=2172099 RepID=A0A2S0VX55_9ALTE|nr:hypothetical protein [Saccharobesus litoralis]AWB68794.1 hypothetical protein C2869_21385 [Saccharobesus litoralis]